MKEAKDLVEKLFNAIMPPEGKEISSLFSSWKNIAGEDCAFHSTVSDLKEGVVFVSVDHPGWMQILHSRQKKILLKIREAYKELNVKEIRFFIGDIKKKERNILSQNNKQVSVSLEEKEKREINNISSQEEFQNLLNKLRTTLEQRTVDT